MSFEQSRFHAARIPIRHADIVEDYATNGCIAHALGEVDGTWYTNSRDAFERSYAEGFRVFEVDLVLLADGTAVAAHDGLESHYGLSKPFSEATWSEVQGLTYRGPSAVGLELEHPIMCASQLMRLLEEYPDAFLVTDTKALRHHSEHIRILQALAATGRDSALRRVAPHVQDAAEIEAVEEVFPWLGYILALYRSQWRGRLPDDEVLELTRAKDIPAVMMWHRPAERELTLAENNRAHQRFSLEFARRLQAEGVGVYVHDLVREADAQRFLELEVGVYSKGWRPPF